jgi:hypothetical protein
VSQPGSEATDGESCSEGAARPTVGIMVIVTLVDLHHGPMTIPVDSVRWQPR